MHFKALLVFLLVFSKLQAQTVEKYYDYNWKPCDPSVARFYSVVKKTDSGYVQHDYFIRERAIQMIGKYSDKDSKVRNGYFTYFHSNGFVQSQGHYVAGKREGLWTSYHSNGIMSDSTVYRGNEITGISLAWHYNGFTADSINIKDDSSGVQVSWFDNGIPSLAGLYAAGKKKTGKWIFYHNNGIKSAIETYKAGKLVEKQYFDENGKEKKDTTNRDKEAGFPGGIAAWQSYLVKKIWFPDQYRLTNGEKAIVGVNFTIDEEGNVKDAFVSIPFHPEFDRIALKAITNSPKWKPAVDHNRKVKDRFTQPVTFHQVDE
jgi:TonB family protein